METTTRTKEAWKTKSGLRHYPVGRHRVQPEEFGTTMSSRKCWRTVVMNSGAPDFDDDRRNVATFRLVN